MGDSPRKTLSSREWARVPQHERQALRQRLPSLLLSEPSRRVAATLALLTANVARFDFPREWPSLVSDLVAAAATPCAPSDASGVAARRAALLGLKRVLAALRGRRLVLFDDAASAALTTPEGALDLRAMAARAAAERDALARAVGASVVPLDATWRSQLASLLLAGGGGGGGGIDAAAAAAAAALCEGGAVPPPFPLSSPADVAAASALCNGALHALREASADLPDWGAGGAESAMGAMCEGLLQSALALQAAGAAGGRAPRDPGPSCAGRGLALAKAFERGVAVATAALERAPGCFARFVPRFLPVFGAALLSGGGGSAAAAAAAAAPASAPSHETEEPRAKARVALTRFLARALLASPYRRDWLRATAAAARTPLARQRAAALAAAAEPAAAALDDLAAGAGVKATLAALLEAYVALSPADAAEWDADPEGYVLAADAEASPDADAPRPCALALVACLVDRGGGEAAQALLDLAAELQGAPTRGPGAARTLLLREAAYRALGECLCQPDLADRLDFGAWWASELRGLLEAGAAPGGVGGGGGAGGGDGGGGEGGDPEAAASLRFARRALVARAAWLAGVGALRLPSPALWAGALSALVALLRADDLVVALSAAASLNAAMGDAIDEAEAAAASGGGGGGGGDGRVPFSFLGGGGGGAGSGGGGGGEDDPDAAADARAAAVASLAGPALAGLVSLLPRVEDDESAVRLLGAASALFELAGRAAAPHLTVLAAALPAVWARASALAGGASSGSSPPSAAVPPNSGAAARLHSALMAVLTHALRRLGRAAAREPAVAGVLWPLLEAATDPGHPEADALADDGARLLRAAIGAAGSVPPPAVSRVLLPRVLRQAGSGRVGERAGYFSILESAVLLGGCGGALLVGGGGEGGGGAAASANGNSSGAAAAASTSRPSPAGDGVSAAAVAIARALSDALEAATADAVEAAVSAAKDGGGGGAGGGEGGGMMEAEQQQQGQLQQSSSLDRDGRNGPPPPPPPPPPPRGALPRPGRGATAAARAAARARRAAREAGAARDALAALSLASAMLQTDLPLAGPALSRSGALRGAAALLAPPPGAGPLPSAVCEAAAGVVARVLFASPGELRALVSPAPSGPAAPADPAADAAVGRLLDAWLRVAGSRQLEEVLGVPAARAAGRARRAAAAAALCRVATAPAGPLSPPPVAALASSIARSARLLALASVAAEEAAAMAADNAELEAAVAERAAAAEEEERLGQEQQLEQLEQLAASGLRLQQGQQQHQQGQQLVQYQGRPPRHRDEAEPDAVFDARVAAAARDPLRRGFTADPRAALAAAARALAAGGREEALMDQLSMLGHGARVRAAVEAVAARGEGGGGGGGGGALAAS